MSDVVHTGSEFKGSFWGFIGQQIVWVLFTVVTFGFGYAYAVKQFSQWMASNVVVSNKQLGFDASAKKLFARVIGLYALYFIALFPMMGTVTTEAMTDGAMQSYQMQSMMVTSSFTSFLFNIVLMLILQNWLIKGMFFVNEKGPSLYMGTQPVLALKLTILSVVSIFSLGLAAPWALVSFIKWYFNNTSISGYRLKFLGTIKTIYLKVLVVFLSIIVAYAIPMAITMANNNLWWVSTLLVLPLFCGVAYLIFSLVKWMITQVEVDSSVAHVEETVKIEEQK